jgi:hypothetical protein
MMDYKIKDVFLIRLLDAVSDVDSDDVKLICNKDTFKLLIDFSNRLDTIPPLLTKYKGNINFAGVSVHLDDSIKPKCVVIEPTGKLIGV